MASFASASLSDPAAVAQLSVAVTEQLSQADVHTLGEAFDVAKKTMAGILGSGQQDTASTFNLLGDPATPNPWASGI